MKTWVVTDPLFNCAGCNKPPTIAQRAENAKICQVLNDAQRHFKCQWIPTAGRFNRCVACNTRMGGAKLSQHLFGTAADGYFAIPNLSAQQRLRLIRAYFMAHPLVGGIGINWSTLFCHVDCRKRINGNPIEFTY